VHRYNYNRDDEEVYKEFLEIANEMIPNIMRTSSGDQSMNTAAGATAELPPSENPMDKLPLTSDPECYAMVLKFYDGLCEWEEGSSTPVLHITWAQHALYSLGRFDFKARASLMLKSATTPVDDIDSKSDGSAASSHSSKLKRTSESQEGNGHRSCSKSAKTTLSPSSVDDISKSTSNANANQVSSASAPAVSENTGDELDTLADKNSSEQTVDEKSLPLTVDALAAHASKTETSAGADVIGNDEDADTIRTCLVLRSEKMTGMKDLLVAERLNSGAIKLQLTAQSQVHLRHSRTAAVSDFTSDATPSSASRKRIRRE